jgi:hypothetical protein
VLTFVVLTVSKEVTAFDPEMAAGWATEQVGGSIAPEGLLVTAQARVTLPAKPPPGVTVMVEVPFAPADAMLTAVPVNAKLGVGGGPLMVIGTLVVCVRVPEMPVTLAV